MAVGAGSGTGVRRILRGGIPCAWSDVGDGAVVAAVLAASGFRSLISMGVGRGVYCWTQMLANLCFAFACSAVVTFGFTLTPNRDADILITFRVGRDLQCWPARLHPTRSDDCDS